MSRGKTNPDKVLALAVFQPAILDLFETNQNVTFADKRDAESFLFARGGGHGVRLRILTRVGCSGGCAVSSMAERS